MPLSSAFRARDFLTWLTLGYTLAMACLMVSRLPVFSGKRIGKRVPPDMVGPLVIVMVLFVALLIAYPWVILTTGTLAYLASLPFGWLSYRSLRATLARGQGGSGAGWHRPRAGRREHRAVPV